MEPAEPTQPPSPPDASPSPERAFDVRFAAVLSGVFLAAALFNVWHHAMWRDEIRTWQVAVASPGLADLWANMRYEGVPALWYLLVWGLTKLAANPFAMQVMHVAIATATVFVVAAAGPFPRAVRSLFAFGYFPFFEYATISRNYALVFLLVMLAVAVIARPRPRPVAVALVLLVLTQVSIWGAGFALLLLATAAFRWTWRREPGTPVPRGRWAVAFALVVAGMVVGGWSALPAPHPSFIVRFPEGTPLLERLSLTFATVWKGWVPLPELKRNFWNSNVLDAVPLAQGVAGVALFVVAALAMSNRPVALALFVAGSAGLMAFTYTQFRGFTRHHGHLFIVLTAAAWLAAVTPAATLRPTWVAPLADQMVRWRGRLFTGLLIVGVAGGVGANVAGYFLPFSMSEVTANFIRDKVPENRAVLVGYNYFALAPISGYLGRPIYYPQTRTWAYYGTQEYGERYPVTPQELLVAAATIADETHKDVILIIDVLPHVPPASVTSVTLPPAGDQPAKTYAIDRAAAFTDATEGVERYLLFRLRRVR
jgi:hypothetical protein